MANITNETPGIRVVRFDCAEIEYYTLARSIREAVFIREQQVSADLEYDHEEESVHYVLFDQDVAKATARWRETPNGIKLERFAVPGDSRNNGLGTILLHRVLADTTPMNKPIYLHAQTTALNYYVRAGFECVGDLFWEAGIAHYRMEFRGNTPNV